MRRGRDCVGAGHLAALLVVVACSAASPTPPPSGAAVVSQPLTRDEGVPPAARVPVDQPFVGDFDQMVGRSVIRAGVVFNRTQYFIDRGVQRGTAYDSLRLFEEQLNQRLRAWAVQVDVMFVPLSRDQLLPALVEGTIDLVAAALMITPERQELVQFSHPTRTNVSAIAVTAKAVPIMTAAADLSGRRVYVQRSSSYYQHLVGLNAELVAVGKRPVTLEEAPEVFEDDDLLEMVNAGLVEAVVVDDFVAAFWQQVFPNLQLHPQAAVLTAGTMAVAVRRNNPLMLSAINAWIEEYGPRSIVP